MWRVMGYVNDPKEPMGRLCALSSEVMSEVFDCQESADCFCLSRAAPAQLPAYTDYRFSPKVLSFIENAVRRAIAQHRAHSALESLAPPQDGTESR